MDIRFLFLLVFVLLFNFIWLWFLFDGFIPFLLNARYQFL